MFLVADAVKVLRHSIVLNGEWATTAGFCSPRLELKKKKKAGSVQ